MNSKIHKIHVYLFLTRTCAQVNFKDIFNMTRFGSNIIIPHGKTQSCEVSFGLLHPVMSARAQTVPLIATSGPESCTIVHELGSARVGCTLVPRGGKAKDAVGTAASNYYRERALARMKEDRLRGTMSILHVCPRP